MWNTPSIRGQKVIYLGDDDDAHLRPAWVLSVIEIIVINAEKRVQGKGIEIPQTQRLEVIYLLH